MAQRVDVIALKPISLGGRHYPVGARIPMAETRVRQYELVSKRTGAAPIRRATPDDDVKPSYAPEPRQARDQAAPEPTPPTREAALVNPGARRGYRNRRLKSED